MQVQSWYLFASHFTTLDKLLNSLWLSCFICKIRTNNTSLQRLWDSVREYIGSTGLTRTWGSTVNCCSYYFYPPVSPPCQEPTFSSSSCLWGLRWEGSVGRFGFWVPGSSLSSTVLSPLVPENSMSKMTVDLTKGNSIPDFAVFTGNVVLGFLH